MFFCISVFLPPLSLPRCCVLFYVYPWLWLISFLLFVPSSLLIILTFCLSFCLSVSLFYFYVPHLFPSFLLIFLSICLSVSLFCFYVPHLFTSFLFIFLSICLSFCFYVQFFLTRVYLALKIAGKFFMLVVNRKVKLVPSLIDEFRLPNCKSKSKILLACGREISVLTSCGGWVG